MLILSFGNFLEIRNGSRIDLKIKFQLNKFFQLWVSDDDSQFRIWIRWMVSTNPLVSHKNPQFNTLVWIEPISFGAFFIWGRISLFRQIQNIIILFQNEKYWAETEVQGYSLSHTDTVNQPACFATKSMDDFVDWFGDSLCSELLLGKFS